MDYLALCWDNAFGRLTTWQSVDWALRLPGLFASLNVAMVGGCGDVVGSGHG